MIDKLYLIIQCDRVVNCLIYTKKNSFLFFDEKYLIDLEML